MPIPSLRKYQARHQRSLFEDLPPPFRARAESHFKRLCERWKGRLPRWRRAILCACARRLAVNPPDSNWGKQMLAKRGGYARQRLARARGINPTEKATRVRLARQRRRMAEMQPVST